MGKHRWPISADARSSSTSAVPPADADHEDALWRGPSWDGAPRVDGAGSPGGLGVPGDTGPVVGRSGDPDSDPDSARDSDSRRMAARGDARGESITAERDSSSRLRALRSRAARAPQHADVPASSASTPSRYSALYYDSELNTEAGEGAVVRADDSRTDNSLRADGALPSDDRDEVDDAGVGFDDDGRGPQNDRERSDGFDTDDHYAHEPEDGYDGRSDGGSGRSYGARSERMTDRHGQPAQPGIRWGVARSAALVFLGVALAVGAALFLVRSSEPSAAAVSVQLGAGSGSQEASGGAAEGDGSNASDAGAGSSPDADGTPASPSTPPAGTVGPSGIDDESGSDPGSGAASMEAGGDGTGIRGAGTIVVYVTGAVASPGVVTMPAGTRLFEILERVGGPLPEADLEGINLAGLPSDGQHLHVLAVGEIPRTPSDLPAPGSSNTPNTPNSPNTPNGSTTGAESATRDNTAGSSQSAGVIDINTATLAEVEALPRVGPVLGQRIIEWRDTNGPFTRPADIDAVPGIGPAMLEGILPLITVR